MVLATCSKLLEIQPIWFHLRKKEALYSHRLSLTIINALYNRRVWIKANSRSCEIELHTREQLTELYVLFIICFSIYFLDLQCTRSGISGYIKAEGTS